MTNNKREYNTVKERLAIYTLAAEKAKTIEDRTNSGTSYREPVFMCNVVADAVDSLNLSPPAITDFYEFRHKGSYTEYNEWMKTNFKEMFLFYDGAGDPSDAWMSDQLMDDGITNIAAVNKTKHVALLLCIEMCR